MSRPPSFLFQHYNEQEGDESSSYMMLLNGEVVVHRPHNDDNNNNNNNNIHNGNGGCASSGQGSTDSTSNDVNANANSNNNPNAIADATGSTINTTNVGRDSVRGATTPASTLDTPDVLPIPSRTNPRLSDLDLTPRTGSGNVRQEQEAQAEVPVLSPFQTLTRSSSTVSSNNSLP